ncbi:MAG: M56 family metallopeptidase [Candidatus Krumholzibacteriota bacterium]|nr:M56 family metallopeptidase [Candidatus Krumholzibacteriota bacterium]
MIASMHAFLANVSWDPLLKLIVDLSIKGTLLCALAGMITLLLRRSSAYIRNIIWICVLGGLIILPVFSWFTPVWQLPLIPRLGTEARLSYHSDDTIVKEGIAAGQPGAEGAAGKNGGDLSLFRMLSALPLTAWVFILWCAGFVLCAGWLYVSRTQLKRIVKTARPVDATWERLLRSISAQMKLNRKVKLVQSGRIKAAITCGMVQPEVVLPASAGKWPEIRRRLVLSHELAHIQRWDSLIEALTSLVIAVYWFNPVVWYAIKQLRIERERDCDNAVLGTGAKPSDYAELLMNIAADLGTNSCPAWQLVTISQGSNLKERLMSILDPKIDRKRGSRRAAMLAGIIALALILPLSTSGIWNTQAGEQQKEKAKQEKLTKEKEKKAQYEAELKQKKVQGKYSAQEKVQQSWDKIMQNENSAARMVGLTIKKKGTKAGYAMFQKLKQSEGEYYFKESEFNTLGYILLHAEKFDESILVFKLNVKEYPDSWNVYDSLGEAYMAAGEYEEAAENYAHSLELNPDNKGGEERLKKLKIKLAQKE